MSGMNDTYCWLCTIAAGYSKLAFPGNLYWYTSQKQNRAWITKGRNIGKDLKLNRIIVYLIDKLLTNVQANTTMEAFHAVLAQLKPSGSFSHLGVFTLQTQLSVAWWAAGTRARGQFSLHTPSSVLQQRPGCCSSITVLRSRNMNPFI